jgi:hypothetical protein
MSNLEALIGQALNEFRVVRMTEVYRTDSDGRYTKSEGCFMGEVEARAYAKSLSDSGYTGTRGVIILTDGRAAYFMGEVAAIADEASVLESIRKKALSKLTAEEIQVLGL